jgi:hypothetical protein
MARAKWSIGDDEPEELETYDSYDGEIPPSGVYRLIGKRLSIVKNRNDDDMLKWIMNINEPKGSPKAQYNGYTVWGQQNITVQGRPFLAAVVKHGLGVGWKDFTSKTITEGDERPTMVKSIGRKKFLDQTFECRAKCSRGEYKGEPRLEFSIMLPVADAEDEFSGDDEPGDEDVF